MKIFFTTRSAARNHKDTVKASGKPAKVTDNDVSVNGSKWGVVIGQKVVK